MEVEVPLFFQISNHHREGRWRYYCSDKGRIDETYVRLTSIVVMVEAMMVAPTTAIWGVGCVFLKVGRKV